MDQFSQLVERIEMVNVELHVVEVNPKGILGEDRQVHQVERIDDTAGNERFVRRQCAVRVVQNRAD